MTRQKRLIDSINGALSLDANRSFNKILREKSFQEWILNLNKSQLFNGENSLGVKISAVGGGYSFVTEILNEGRVFSFNGESKTKRAGGSPILFDTGKYYDSFEIILGDGFFRIDSDPVVDSGQNLEDRYGDDLEGLNDENLQKIIDAIRVKFVQEARKALQPR